MRTTIPKQSYWDGTGKHQALNSELHKLIPHEGECRADQPALEALRVANNCYYDLFNNGLCNRAREFGEVFGFIPAGTYEPDWEECDSRLLCEQDMDDQRMIGRIERKMDKLILAAAKEQGLNPRGAENEI